MFVVNSNESAYSGLRTRSDRIGLKRGYEVRDVGGPRDIRRAEVRPSTRRESGVALLWPPDLKRFVQHRAVVCGEQTRYRPG
jgi:hypothetical protein